MELAHQTERTDLGGESRRGTDLTTSGSEVDDLWEGQHSVTPLQRHVFDKPAGRPRDLGPCPFFAGFHSLLIDSSSSISLVGENLPISSLRNPLQVFSQRSRNSTTSVQAIHLSYSPLHDLPSAIHQCRVNARSAASLSTSNRPLERTLISLGSILGAILDNVFSSGCRSRGEKWLSEVS